MQKPTDKQFPLIDFHDGGYGIFIRKKVFQEKQESEIASFLQNSIACFKNIPGKNLFLRFEESDRSRFFGELLKGAGFVYQTTRVEYKTPIQEILLSGNPPSNFAFKTLYHDHDIEMDATLKILCEIYNADEHNLDGIISETSIAERLEKKRLAEKRENVELAYLNDSLIGVVITSITEDMKVGSIDFMGLSPAQKGKGLGKWLFQQAICRFITLNVKEYIDGTDCTNVAMKKIFEGHNCKKFLTLHEWKLGRDS